MTDDSVLRDPARLEALQQLNLADGSLKPVFDRFTRLATRILNVPIVLISLVDGDRQVFVSMSGLPEPWASRGQTSLSHSFCQHVVTSGVPLIVNDACEVPLLHDNLAISDMGFIAYAGYPLVTPEGYVLGSFCAINTRPHEWTDAERSIIEDITASVNTEISLRRELERRNTVMAERAMLEQALRRVLNLYELLQIPRPRDELFQAILEAAVESIPNAQRGSLLVKEEDYYVFHAAVGYELSRIQAVKFSAQDSLVRHDDLLAVQHLPGFDAFNEYLRPEDRDIMWTHGMARDIRASLLAQIIVFEQPFGRLVVDNLQDSDPFPSSAEALVLFFAQQAGQLIEHQLIMDSLRTTRSQLIQSEKLAAVGQLVAGVAHELNNPLTAILGYSDLLSMSTLLPEDREAIDLIRESGIRMREIIGNLSLFARQHGSERRLVRIDEVIHKTLLLKQFTLRQHNIQLVYHAQMHTGTVWADPGQLQQVLLNLITNAEHALAEQDGDRHIVISTDLDSQQERIIIDVRDNGPGIASDVLPRIFEPFFTTKAPGQGTGLGLSICYGIIQAHHGELSVDTTAEVGTTFRITLPSIRHVADAIAEQTEVVPLPQGYRILVVEDEPVIAAYLTQILGQTNSVQVASDGQAALDVLTHWSAELLISDLKMPGMNGQAFFARIEEQYPDLARATVFMSGDTSSEATQAWLRRMGRPVLLKPFTRAELAQTLGQVVAPPV